MAMELDLARVMEDMVMEDTANMANMVMKIMANN